MVVGGTRDVVGSDRSRVFAAIAEALSRQDAPDLTVRRGNGGVEIAVGAGIGEAEILLIGYDRTHQTAVDRGENAGRILTESNVVRALSNVGHWRGTALRLAVPQLQGESLAALLQAPDGRMLAAGEPEYGADVIN
jgi:hypothetical protein